ncbi:ATP-binding cassette domain-containing protein [Actinomarinicola tropica]|uniref:ATP-binding cassette domain-containing protein n=2 Tax=Actinomarinicola tropica TaxID=2789776 RepID=A0A5Q2RRG9_9ACTN|nr:ATP-binding cassette domain-containing protein [Actinomarinicola tropica]
MLRARRHLFAAALSLSALSMVANVAVPRVVGLTINEALDARTAELTTFVWILLGLAVARGVTTLASRFFLFKVAYGLEYDLRVTVYEHLSRLSFSYFDRVQSGQLISRANSDIRSVQMFLTFAPMISLQALTFVLAFGLMLTVHVPLTLVALLPLPFVFLVGVRMRSFMFPISWVVQSRTADVATIVEEDVSGIRVVKSFAAEQQQVNALAAAADRLRWATTKQIDLRATYAPMMENLPRLGTAIVLLYGGWLAIDGAIRIGDIVTFTSYVVMLQAPFRMIGMLMMMSQRAAASAARIYEILDERPEIVDRPGAVDLVDPVGDVRFRDVHFSYASGHQVLDGLDLEVGAGETVAIVGRTGSGKSTVVRLLTRFYDVDDGAVEIDGHDVRDLTLRSLRHHVGIVLDEPFLFSTSIRDNIAYGRPDAPMEEVVAAAAAANAAEFVDRLPDGYDTLVGERGYTLSGGQRQRLAIARTLVVNPKVLVLDDATSAIDVRIEEQIHEALARLMADRTTIVIAHRLSTISLADRVALLEGGRIVAQGTHADLMAEEPRYQAVLAHLEEDQAARAAAHAARAEAQATRAAALDRLQQRATGGGFDGPGGMPGGFGGGR